jgi:hypothetical protein
MEADFDMVQGPTLYDFAGMPFDATYSRLLDRMAELSNERPGASRIRAALAIEALLDDDFRTLYDQHLANGTPWREQNQLPLLPDMPAVEWGSAEMAEWVKQASGVLAPKRPDPGKLAALSHTCMRLADRHVSRFLYPLVVLTSGALAHATFGLTILDTFRGVLGGPTVSLALLAGLGAALGTLFTAAHHAMRSWKAQGCALLVAASLAFIAARPSVMLPVTALVMVIFYVFAGASDRSRKVWVTSTPTPLAPPSPWEPVDGQSRTRLGAGTADPAQAAAVLRAWSQRLGHPLADASLSDLVAATVASDAWAFALGADSLAQAASFGPASLGAISAALARASGFAEEAMPLLPGPESTESRMPGLQSSLLDWKSWAELQLGRREASKALFSAAADLSWGGGNEDRLSRLARTLVR